MSANTTLPPPPEYKPQTRVHLDYLDGLRALAALWVVLGHANLFIYGWSVPGGRLRSVPFVVLHHLHLAVNLFIVLSGFCLAMPFVRRASPVPWSDFFRKRARRIVPTYYAAIGFCLLLNFVPPHYTGFDSLHLPKLPLAGNLLLLQDVGAANFIAGPFWSIAVEWHIYFLFPAMMWVLARSGRWAVLGAGALVGYGIVGLSALTGFPSLRPWYLLLFAMGVCAASVAFSPRRVQSDATLFRRWARIGIALCMVLGAVLHRYLIVDGTTALNFERHERLIDPIFGAVAATLLIVLQTGSSEKGIKPLVALLSWQPLVFLGTFSYSLYLIHNPIQTVAHNLLLSRLSVLSPAWQFSLFGGLLTALVLPTAYLFFLAFERPFMTRRKNETPAEVARDAALSPAP